ncbi:hypothetical protein BDW02DRAFT_577369 [Decorospora gaudefroyi]|uniref:Rhodopsin domain-containing protein n=1 Tax=Decorospora gaudefroyi TaxID=184978 RepID=A0A6A5KRQ8_9PLEO|nr:hypothetical protein BDW02DRAFT_577369 [Decorospora gaudefroyi]
MATNFVAEAWSELAIGLVFIGLRLYFRYMHTGMEGITWDDLLMILAGLLYACETTAAHLIVAAWHNGGNNSFTPDIRAKLDPNSEKWRHAVNGSKAHVFGWFMYTSLVWTLKCCWTIYYSRMTNGIHRMDVRIKLAWALNGITYLAAVCMILFKCWPLHRQWQIYPDPGNTCYPGASKLNVLFITTINVATDLFLMAIPIPIIHGAKLSMKKKIPLFILFSGGHIVIIFGILRCVTLVTVGPTEPSESGHWSVRESFVAVLISNAPMVFPLLKRIPNDTAWASDEAIVVDGKFAVLQEGAVGEKDGGPAQDGNRGSVAGRAVSIRHEPDCGHAHNHGGILKTREWQLSEVYEEGGRRKFED